MSRIIVRSETFQTTLVVHTEKKDSIKSIKGEHWIFFQLNQLNIYLRQWKYLFEFNETLYWTAIRKFYRFQIKVPLKEIFNETVYLIQINI